MRFVEHGVYLVRNRETGESKYFEALEVLQYEGQYIVYGEMRTDAIHMPLRGVILTPGKPTAFPVLPNAALKDIAGLIVACGGSPIGISEAPAGGLVIGNLKAPVNEELPVINCNSRLAEIWGGTPWLKEPKRPNRDGLVKKCVRQIDLYLETLRLGHYPAWFYEDRAKARGNVARN